MDAIGGDLLWQFEKPWSTLVERERFSALTVVDGAVYAASDNGKVYALDGSTGHLSWQYDSGTDVDFPPTVGGGIVYANSRPEDSRSPAFLHALEASTGDLLWRHEVGGEHFAFVTEQDRNVYIGSQDGSVSMLDGLNGQVQWHHEFGHFDPLSRDFMIDRSGTLPVVVEGVVYVGARDSSVYALDAADMCGPADRSTHLVPQPTHQFGDLLWRIRAPSNDDMSSDPTEAGGMLYMTLYDNSGRALDSSSGSLVWSFRTGGWIHSSPTVVDSVVYVGSRDRHVDALDASDGTLLWRYATDDEVFYPTAGFEGVVYVGAGAYLYALQASTGEQRWRQTGRFAEPEVNQAVIHAVYGDRDQDRLVEGVSALDAETGDILWRYHTNVRLGRQATVADGVVYVTPSENYLDLEHGYTGWYLYALTGPEAR